MNRLYKILLLVITWTASLSGFGQSVEMADNFRGEGKIYVVVIVVLLLLIGLFFYLFRIDRRLTKLEEDQNSEQ